MAGKKRRSKASVAAGGKASSSSSKKKSSTTTTPSTTTTVPIRISSTILRHLLDIASSKKRSEDVLQTFYDGRCWTEIKQVPARSSTSITTTTTATATAAASNSSSSTMASAEVAAAAATFSSRYSNNKKEQETNFDCYWIVLATNIMNRLLALENEDNNNNNNKKSTAILNYLTALADAITTILLSDKGKIERSSHQATSRSILCRAILTSTMAALYGIRNYDPQQKQKQQQQHETYGVAVATLDKLVHLRGFTNNGNSSNSNNSSSSPKGNTNVVGGGGVNTDTRLTAGSWTVTMLEDECVQIDDLLESFINSENDCVNALLEATQVTGATEKEEDDVDDKNENETERVETTNIKSPPAKRTARTRGGGTTKSGSKERKTTTSATINSIDTTHAVGTPTSSNNPDDNLPIDPVPVITAFEKLLASEDFGNRIDGRVAIKRWASIAVVWSQQGEGQLILLRGIHQIATEINVMAPKQKSRLMSPLICIISEAGIQCGVRPSTGGIDQYLKSITASSSSLSPSVTPRDEETGGSSGTTTNSNKKNKILRRADIRNWTTVVIYDYLQNHKECIQQTVDENSEDCKQQNASIHDNINSNNKDDAQAGFYVPNFADLITNLCRSASSSSIPNSSYTQQSYWNKALLSIAAAFCLELVVDNPELPLDCKLISFALSHLVDCIRRADPQSTLGSTSSADSSFTGGGTALGGMFSVSDQQQRDFESKYLLCQQLPKPIVPSMTPSKRSSDDGDGKQDEVDYVSNECNFAGLLEDDSFTDEHAVSLAIRAVQKSRADQNPAAGKLLTFLTDVVRRTYDTRKPKVEKINDEGNIAKVSAGKRKRGSNTRGSSVNRRGARRRKTESGEVAHVNDDQSLEWNRISSESASVATSALNALRLCLMNTKRLGSCTIRQVIRSTITVEHIIDLINLGEMLDKALVKTRQTTTFLAESSTRDLSSVAPTTTRSDQDFTGSDKLLWSAHMNMCQVLGRGQLTYETNSGLDPVIWDTDKRKAVYEAIAASNDSGRSRTVNNWSLSLPAAHNAFLAANLSCASNEEDKGPERYIVMGYVNSINDALGSLETLKPKKWDSDGRLLDDEIPLSYNDSRTFILALNGLCHTEKRLFLDIIVKSALGALKSITENETKRSTVCQNTEASGFIARVLVICYSLVNNITVGKELQKAFLASMGCTQLCLPSFITRADWYRRDRTFMGIFDAWESPSLPESIPERRDTVIPNKSLSDFRLLLERAFSIGLEAAVHDHCHLLFTAWNGLDQVPEDTGPSAGSKEQVPTLSVSMGDYSKKILQLREDVCSTYKAVGCGMPVNLKGMVSRASELVELLLKNHIPDDEEMKQEIPLPIMVLLAALPTYISACVAANTKPGNDYFSTTLSKSSTRKHKRRRGYSSESDPPPAESDSEDEVDDYEDEVRIDAMSRLRECCDAFGAAPIHPDWLDVSCSLHDGIRPSDAIEVAEVAIKTLSRLATVAFTQYKKHQSWTLKEAVKDQKDFDKRANLCTTLLGWSRREMGQSQYPHVRDWRDDVATVTKIPQEVMNNLLDDVPDRDVEHAKACWCPYAGQRSPGLLQDESRLTGGWDISNAELRAGGEWELLLAEALTLSCLNMNRSEDDETKTLDPEDDSFSPEASSEMAKVQLWKVILMSATSHLVPAAALLRLGLGEVGRKPHPFAFHENNEDPYDVAPLHFSERLNNNGVVSYAYSSSLSVIVHETLTMLARLSIEAEDSLSVTCHAVASHLVIDSNTFLDLEGLYSVRCAFMGIKHIREIVGSSPKKDVKTVLPFLVERLVSIIEESGRGDNVISMSETSGDSATKFRRLHYFLGGTTTHLVDTLTNKSIDIFKILRNGQLNEICEDQADSYNFSHNSYKKKAVGELVKTLCEDSLRANGRTRSHIALMLSRVGIIESQSVIYSSTAKDTVVVPAIIEAFNKVDRKILKSIVLKDLCGLRGSKSPSETFKRDIASIFCLLLFAQSNPRFERAKFLHDTLMAAFDSWKKMDTSHRELTLKVLLTYGSFFNSFLEIGSKLVDSSGKVATDNESSGEAELLSNYFVSIKNLQLVLIKGDQILPRSCGTRLERIPTSLNSVDLEVSSDFPRSCSFTQKSGFHGQHWYHCHTCNLVSDKGCCTLCALVCHRDHDVQYSRHSSFFCDCAAEDGNPSVKQSRVSCKCLSSLPTSQLRKIYENERLGMRFQSNKSVDEKCDNESENAELFEDSILVEIANHSFADTALKSVNKFLRGVKDSNWLDSLFDVVGEEFKIWKAEFGDPIHLLMKKPSEASFDSTPILRLSHDSIQKKLRKRKSKVLEWGIGQAQEKDFVSVRAATGFQAKFSSDSHDALTLARLSRNDISRSIMAIDSRGRMIVAEPSSLVFCSPIAAVNATNAKRSDEDEHFSRHQMCIIGTAVLGFNVVGLCLCAENERHIVVWGTSEACVLVLKTDYSGVEDTINLTFEVDDQDGDGDVLVNCAWLPESQTHVAVGVSRFVRLFDVCRFEKSGDTKRAHPVIGYNLGFEACLRDLSIVPQKEDASSEGDGAGSLSHYRAEHISKMFLLLENGRLHSLDIKISNGKIESPSELHFEPSECVSIATEGIRPRPSSSIGLPGASTRTLGEGSKLVYLKQSRCLLYKCKSAAVVALMLSAEGNVEGTFELLPHTVSSTVLGSDDSDGYSISGPYTLWTELGMVYRKGTAHFRVACVGRSTRSGQSKLICIEFNEKETKIKEIAWSSTSSFGLGLHHGSFEGLAAFTAPIVQADTSFPDRYMTGEKSFLCALSSGGNLLIFGEDVVDMMPTSIGPNGSFVPSNPLKLVTTSAVSSTPIRKVPLTLFEQLINVSESESLLFSSGQELGIDSKELKRRLARDSSTSFACPRREGCCLAISLVSNNKEVIGRSKSATKPPELVISAIRVLIGSSSECMPSKISVQGRAIDITPRSKRWYNIPLTEEEIARGVRTGLVSLWVGQSFDPTNSPVLDSVEVFASERKTVENFIPRNYFASNSTPNLEESSRPELKTNVLSSTYNKSGLILGVRAISNLCELIGPTTRVSEKGKELLQELVQDTAVHPEKQLGESVQMLCRALDFDTRSTFQDENVLVGCSKSLARCKALLIETSADKEDENNKSIVENEWKAIQRVLQDCLKASSLIARERPSNYLQSMGSMENNAKSSIAIEASKLILEGLRNKSPGFEELIGGIRGTVFLLLTELALVDFFSLRESASTKGSMQLSSRNSLIKEFLDAANFPTCEAISTFFQDNGDQNKSYIPDLFVKMEAMKEVAYQCDSCEICPMKEVRYTILDEDYGIDLCKECYGVGKNFAANKKYNSSIEVVINGKSVGGLTCAHMKEMEPVSLEKMEMDVEQVDVQEGSGDEDEELQKALKLSLGENLIDDDNSQDLSADHRGYEYFLGELFSFVMDQFSCAFKKERCDNSVESLIKLVLDLIRHSKRECLKKERATWLVRDVSKGISNILGSSSRDQKLTHYKMSTLVTCLRALSTLSSSESEFHFPGSKSDAPDVSHVASHVAIKEQKNSKFSCNVHGIPAVRRKCDKGANKDRRFYVCGKEKGQRCDYFVWADEMQKEMEKMKSKSQFYEIVKTAMLDPTTSSGTALYDRLCILLEVELFGEDGDAYETNISLTSSTKEKKSEDSLLKSFYSIQNMESDFNDGVFCSKEKISDVISGEALVNSEMSGTHEVSRMMPVRGAGDRGAKLLEASLDLLTLIADHNTHGIARWFSILCEINMATNKHSSLRSLATNVLKLLCGGDRTKYHYVRDHYTFCFQLKRLYHFSYNMLEDALIVKEKTRQCSVNWKGPALEWSTLGTGDLIGTQDLISEDAVTEINYKCCGKALDEMWSVIKNRGQSWRQFCGYTKLPLTNRQSKTKFADVAPIKALMWIACSTQGINQVKVLRLIDFALSDWKGRESSNTTVGVPEEDGNNEKDPADYQVLGIGSAASKPEELLMMLGESKLGIYDVIALSLCMVRGGKTSELRRVAYHIVLRLSRVMSCDDQWFLFRNLLTAVEDIGMLGKGGAEFLNLLQMLAQHLKPNDFIGPMADIVVNSFIQQLDAIKYDRSNGEWTILETNTGSSATRKRFDLSGCIFCLKPQHHSGSRESSSKPSDRRAPQTNSGRGSARGGPAGVVAGRTGTGTTTGTRYQKWHSEQVAPFSRGRLETVKENCTSNEFNLIYKLKYRIAISDIHLTISDPRGRYVKTISIYNTSRPLSSSLKSDQYSSKWEKIASLTLSRGGTRASATLSQPIVSANLRVEFTDFYERPGDKDNKEGSLHCPRCTRPVTNAHGVCVTCGEVAFQCRKCRHINYDRLDAFLCVECGYTCCGSFSFELNYAVATNAIAITDDKVLDKSIKMYGISSSIQEGLREKLGGKLRSMNKNKANDEMEMDSFFDPTMQRAFLGLLPTDADEDGGKYSPNSAVIASLEKQGSVVKYVAHPDTSLGGGSGRSTSTSNRSDRARSLLRLARQIRSESSSSSERRRSTDIIIRHLGRGISLENLEDENELLELLDSGNSGTGDANDAINNIDQSESKDDDPQGNTSISRKNDEKNRKAEAEECQKMLVLLREAGRESYELRRRIDAWKRLNAGALIDSGPSDITEANGSFSFTPSHCSVCGGTIAYQLLGLWHHLFVLCPTKVDRVFFNILFQEDVPNQGRGLQDLKKQVIVSIATNSQNGAEIVLRELRTRLTASHDMNCAEILGKIMEIEGFDMLNEYAKLAMDILSSRTNTAVGKM